MTLTFFRSFWCLRILVQLVAVQYVHANVPRLGTTDITSLGPKPFITHDPKPDPESRQRCDERYGRHNGRPM